MAQIPFFVSIPHSGEKVPPMAGWLQGLPETTLMCDVDRYVDWLYEPALAALQIPFVKTEWHRYAGDLNRIPDDVDMSTVKGSPHPAGMHNRGFLWAITTTEIPLLKEPVEASIHQSLVDLIYQPFHSSISDFYEKFAKNGARRVFHLDVHSMPSVGTRQHRDPGERRAEVVVSDCKGLSCSPAYRDLVISAYCIAGFKVGYNWPYFGGRVTEQYGSPAQGREALQVELSRSLYMDEVTKKVNPEPAAVIQEKLKKALQYIQRGIPQILG